MGVDFSFEHIIWCLGGGTPDLCHSKAHPHQAARLWGQAVGVLFGAVEKTYFAFNLTYFTPQIGWGSDMAWGPMIVHPHFHAASP
jgi:hypothetical protein